MTVNENPPKEFWQGQTMAPITAIRDNKGNIEEIPSTMDFFHEFLEPNGWKIKE